MTPLARTSDPDTSRDAAWVAKMNRQWTRLAVMEALWALDQATDEQIEEWSRVQIPCFSPSGLRTRRLEMQREGKVRQVRYPNGMFKYRRTRSGCEALVWELTPQEGEE